MAKINYHEHELLKVAQFNSEMLRNGNELDMEYLLSLTRNCYLVKATPKARYLLRFIVSAKGERYLKSHGE